MIVALTYVAISIGVLLLLTFVYVVEDAKGERFFFLKARAKLDTFLSQVLHRVELFMFSLSNSIVRLLLHYGAHSILKRMLAVIRSLEEKVEDLVRRNRRIAKGIGALRTKGHLSTLQDHKEEVALSEEEKKQLRSHD